MPKSNSGKPWERQEGETEKAFEAFSVYRDLQGSARTFTAVAEKLHKSCTLIRRWKTQYNWESRVLAYDNHLQNAATAEAEKQCKEMTERHIKIAKQLQLKALEALKNLKPEGMTPKDIKEFLKLGVEMEQFSRTSDIEKQKETATGNEVSLADAIMSSYQNRKESENGDKF